MQKNFYYKFRFMSEIYGPSPLHDIIALGEHRHIQISDLQKVNWVWLDEFIKKNNIDIQSVQ